MAVDAGIVDLNTIRLDSQNVLALTLSPGSSLIDPAKLVKVLRQGNRLLAQPREETPVELLPVNDTEFFILEGPVQIIFMKDEKGTVTSFKGWQNGQEFTGKKIN